MKGTIFDHTSVAEVDVFLCFHCYGSLPLVQRVSLFFFFAVKKTLWPRVVGDKKYKQKSSSKSCKIEIKILANPELA